MGTGNTMGDSGTLGAHYVFWKRAASGAESNPTIATSVSADKYAQAFVISGCVTTGTPFDLNGSAVYWGWGGPTDPDTITTGSPATAGADRLVVICGADADDTAASVTITATDPATFTSPTNGWVESATGADGSLFVQYATKASAGSIGAPTLDFSATPDGWAIAVLPFIPKPTAAYDQDAYRFRNDDGNETAATWRQALNTPDTVALDEPFRLRLAVEETAGGDPASTTFLLRYRRKPSGGAFGSWNTVDTGATQILKTAVVARDSTHLTDGGSTTQQITSGTFVAGQTEDSAGTIGTAIDLGPSSRTEIEWSLIIPSTLPPSPSDGPAVAGDTVEFGIYLPGLIALDTYTNTPSLTVGGGLSRVSQTRVMLWALNARATSTRTLLAAVKARVAGERTLLAAVKARVSNTRVLLNSVVARATQTRALLWGVTGKTFATRTLLSTLRARVTAERTLLARVLAKVSSTRALLNSVIARVAQTRTLLYGVTGRVFATRALLAAVRSRVVAERVLHARVYARVSGTRTLLSAVNARVFDVRTLLASVSARVAGTRTLLTTVRARVNGTRTLLASVRERVAGSRVLLWQDTVRAFATRALLAHVWVRVSGSRAMLWGITERASSTRALLWQVIQIGRVFGERALLWGVSARASATRVFLSQVLARTSATRILLASVRAKTAATRSLLYAVTAEARVAAVFTALYAIRERVAHEVTLQSSVRSRASSERTLPWVLRTATQGSRVILWYVNALGRVTSARTLLWAIGSLRFTFPRPVANIMRKYGHGVTMKEHGGATVTPEKGDADIERNP
jgi:hypothetical protein